MIISYTVEPVTVEIPVMTDARYPQVDYDVDSDFQANFWSNQHLEHETSELR